MPSSSAYGPGSRGSARSRARAATSAARADIAANARNCSALVFAADALPRASAARPASIEASSRVAAGSSGCALSQP